MSIPEAPVDQRPSGNKLDIALKTIATIIGLSFIASGGAYKAGVIPEEWETVHGIGSHSAGMMEGLFLGDERIQARQQAAATTPSLQSPDPRPSSSPSPSKQPKLLNNVLPVWLTGSKPHS